MRLLSRVNGLYCRTDELNFPVCSLLFLSIYAASLLHGSAVRLSLHLPVTISSPFHIIKGGGDIMAVIKEFTIGKATVAIHDDFCKTKTPEQIGRAHV